MQRRVHHEVVGVRSVKLSKSGCAGHLNWERMKCNYDTNLTAESVCFFKYIICISLNYCAELPALFFTVSKLLLVKLQSSALIGSTFNLLQIRGQKNDTHLTF